MNNERGKAMMGFLAALAFLFSFSYVFAEEQHITQTNTVYFSLSDDKTQIASGTYQTYLKNIQISSWQSLKDFSLETASREGVSNVSIYVNGLYCDTVKIPVIGKSQSPCTAQVLANLTNTVLNVTLINHGLAESANDDLILHTIQGRFTIDADATLNVSTLTQAQLDALKNDINGNMNSQIGQLYTDLTTWFSTNVGSKVWSFLFGNGQTAEDNVMAMNASNVTYKNRQITITPRSRCFGLC